MKTHFRLGPSVALAIYLALVAACAAAAEPEPMAAAIQEAHGQFMLGNVNVGRQAVANALKLSEGFRDNSKFSGLVLRSDGGPQAEQRSAEKRLREICGLPAAQASDFVAWAAVLVELRRFDEAIYALEKTLKLAPGHSRIHEGLAVLHNQLANDLRVLDPKKAAEHEKRLLDHMKRAARLQID